MTITEALKANKIDRVTCRKTGRWLYWDGDYLEELQRKLAGKEH